MNYIYDIDLNFQRYYCEFYEWSLEDKIYNVKKIPLYHIKTEDFNNFKYYDVVVDKEFLDMLKKDLGNIKKNMCLVSDGNMGMGILLNDQGRIIKRSSLIYDEEDEVCGYSLDFDLLNIKYNKIKKKANSYDLRFFRKRKSFLRNYLNKIKEDIMWKYLYYECYGLEEDNVDKIKKTLLDITNNVYSVKNKKLYNIINSFSKIRN